MMMVVVIRMMILLIRVMIRVAGMSVKMVVSQNSGWTVRRSCGFTGLAVGGHDRRQHPS